MASVEESVECPQCGQKAFLEFHTRTFEEESLCPVCGYCESTRPEVDRRKQRQDPEHRAWVKRRRDGDQILRTTKHVGFEAYYLAQNNGVGILGAFNCNLTPKLIANFNREMAKPGVDAQKCFLTRWNLKRGCTEVVVGRIPKALP